MSRIAERLFPWLAASIALLLMVIGFDELHYESARRPHQLTSVLFAFAFSVLFGIGAASCWLRLRIRRLVALVCGACLTVYTLSALREGGWGDANGIVLVGIVVSSGITAALGIILGAKGFTTKSPPDTSLERARGE
jgi:threonine/homoserine efflux transporter RhtA